MIEMDMLHCEKPVSRGNATEEYIKDPERMTWRRLIEDGLCVGLYSPCVTGKCEVMCAYGKRYLREKEQHAG